MQMLRAQFPFPRSAIRTHQAEFSLSHSGIRNCLKKDSPISPAPFRERRTNHPADALQALLTSDANRHLPEKVLPAYTGDSQHQARRNGYSLAQSSCNFIIAHFSGNGTDSPKFQKNSHGIQGTALARMQSKKLPVPPGGDDGKKSVIPRNARRTDAPGTAPDRRRFRACHSNP